MTESEWLADLEWELVQYWKNGANDGSPSGYDGEAAIKRKFFRIAQADALEAAAKVAEACLQCDSEAPRRIRKLKPTEGA